MVGFYFIPPISHFLGCYFFSQTLRSFVVLSSHPAKLFFDFFLWVSTSIFLSTTPRILDLGIPKFASRRIASHRQILMVAEKPSIAATLTEALVQFVTQKWVIFFDLPSGNLLHNYGKSPFLIGKSTMKPITSNNNYGKSTMIPITMVNQLWFSSSQCC